MEDKLFVELASAIRGLHDAEEEHLKETLAIIRQEVEDGESWNYKREYITRNYYMGIRRALKEVERIEREERERKNEKPQIKGSTSINYSKFHGTIKG